MAVVKFIKCSQCKGHIAQVDKEPDLATCDYTCPKCGSAPRVSSKWSVSMYIVGCDGRSQKHVKVIGSKKEAEAYERRMLSEKGEGSKVNTERKDWSYNSFLKVFDEWINDRLIEGKLAESTALFYRKRISNHIKPWLGKLDIRSIDADMVDSYRVKRLKVVTAATVNKEIATLKRSLSIALKKKWIKVNPLADYEMLDEDNESDRFLDSSEINAMLTSCQDIKAPKHLYPIVVLALNTGLRIDGVLGLRWEDVKWDLGEIHRVVKGGKAVRIPITQALSVVLKQWQNRNGVCRINGWVFPSPKKTNDRMLITGNFGLKAAFKRIGIIDCSFHTLRHTFATHVLEQHPEQIEVLAVIMGHSSSYMTRRYAHITDKSRHAVMANIQIGS